MKINLISRDNGAGLSTDMILLEKILSDADHDVLRVDWTSRSMPTCDVGIFLELLQPKLFPAMRHAVGIFNPEWFMPQWRRYMANMTHIWAKSHEAYDAFSSMGHKKKTHLTGFASRDLWDPSVDRMDKCFHLKGHSDLKNTQSILEAWRNNPDLPELVIVSNNPIEDVPGNVTLMSRVSNYELKRLMNECYIHLCPSRAEGWGHYITEGLSVGAMVVTTDASPMNEQIRPEWGKLIAPSASHRRGMVREYDVDPEDIADAVRDALTAPAPRRDRQSQMAREYLRMRNRSFEKNVLRLLGEL